MDESIPSASQLKTRAEYRAAIRGMLDEIHRLFAEMDQNRAEYERMRAQIEFFGARSDTTLGRIRNELEQLRTASRHNAERAD
jgi:chlorite dismutase